MSKRFTKIICAAVSVAVVAGTVTAAGCSYGGAALPGDIAAGTAAVSNGGFAVEKANYIYYINGVETNTADNAYGKPEKGAIYRVSKNSLEDRNYADVDLVVPQIAYSSNYDTGIFIYGDRVYYGTPSTNKNAEGVIQNSYLEMKSSKLDGSETMINYYVQFPDASYNYRYVECGEGNDKTVYLMYVATSETLYDESTGVTNLHSYNTSTGKDTLLAYNVESVIFDDSDKTNPCVYYTMKVRNYMAGSDYGYNQVYTVSADATEDKFAGKLSSETVVGWKDGEGDEKGDIYVNCGDLVFDGVGKKDVISAGKSIFNYNYGVDATVNNDSYTYTLEKYTNDKLFYTRKTSNNDSNYLFLLDGSAALAPVSGNPDKDDRLLSDGSNADAFKYIFNDGVFEGVIISETDGGVSINKLSNGKLHDANEKPGLKNENYFKIIKEGGVTLLFLDTENNYLYYSLTGGNDLSVYRIDYSGSVEDYEPLQVEDTGYTPVKILDLDASSTWYKPEIIDGYLFFASSTNNMTAYNPVMVFDMNTDGGIITNAEIRALNEKYNGIEKIIKDTFGNTDKYPADTYANVQNIVRYAFYGGDYDYLLELAGVVNAEAVENDKNADPVYSDKTLAEYVSFITPKAGSVWDDYADDTKTVNGKTVYANSRDYYYSVLGKLTESNEQSYQEGLRSSYLVSYPEAEDLGWYGNLNTVAKVFFIIGMCAIGIIVIGGGVVLTLYFVKKNREKLPAMKKRVKVDMTDDKNIDVYNYDDENKTTD